jgi:hypothetical protein
MGLRKRVVAAAIALLVAVGVGSFVVAAPAAASPACADGFICLYEHEGGAGSSLWLLDQPGACYQLSAIWNDRISSVKSQIGHTVRVRDNFNCTGSYVYLNYGGYVNDLGGFPYFFNDRVSAVQFS